MIAKGNLHAHGTKLAAYLTTSYADEKAELVELRGFAATNIRDGFVDVQIQAAATRAAKPFFHAYVRAPEGERLSREAWQAFADRLEHRIGFDGQPRAIAFHHGADGESHMHIAWSRINLDTLTAIDPGLYKNKMKQLCREFEIEFGLTRVSSERAPDVRTRSANRPEFEQSRRLGTDLQAVRNAIHDCWQNADSGRAFLAALNQAGMVLARGDRRDFVVIDPAGGEHALSKRITGENAPAMRLRMADIDRAELAGVDAAKAAQLERFDRQARREPAMNDTVDQAKPQFDDEKALAQRERLVFETSRLAEAERAQAEMHSARRYREQAEREAEEARKTAREQQQKDSDRAAAGDITDAHGRYAQALGATYSIRDPYGSLANAAMVEYASFHRQQDALRQAAAAEQDPEKRQLIDLRRQIEGHEYMAITSERLAGISRAITMGDSASARRDDDMAKAYKAMAVEKRQERAELQRELQQRGKDERTATEHGAVRPARAPSDAERAVREAAGLVNPPRGTPARLAQAEQDKQREGLRPDQPAETASPTKEARAMSAAEKAIRDAAGPDYRDKAATPRDTGRPQGRPRGGGRGGR